VTNEAWQYALAKSGGIQHWLLIEEKLRSKNICSVFERLYFIVRE
jgi:hypothetical protein